MRNRDMEFAHRGSAHPEQIEQEARRAAELSGDLVVGETRHAVLRAAFELRFPLLAELAEAKNSQVAPDFGCFYYLRHNGEVVGAVEVEEWRVRVYTEKSVRDGRSTGETRPWWVGSSYAQAVWTISTVGAEAGHAVYVSKVGERTQDPMGCHVHEARRRFDEKAIFAKVMQQVEA